MTEKIPTNRLDLSFDYSKIDADFSIYYVAKTNGEHFNHSIFDFPVAELKARSVAYMTASAFYVLFDKGSNMFQVRSLFTECDENAIVKQLVFCDICALPKHILAQLLFNSLNVCEDFEGNVAYNNISGKLYYLVTHDIKNGVAKFLNLTLDKNMFLGMSGVTYSKLKNKPLTDAIRKKPRYVFNEQFQKFMCASQAENTSLSECYFKKSFSKNRKPFDYVFFNRKKIEEYGSCKINVFCRFIKDVRRFLSKYITSIETRDLEAYETFETPKNLIQLDSLKMKQLNFNIVDLVNDDVSCGLKDDFCEYFKTVYEVDVTVGDYVIDALNFIIVHNREYYEGKELDDPYKIVYPGVVQHITIEDFFKEMYKNKSSTFRTKAEKVRKELLIKHDIYTKQLSLVNCTLTSPWVFVMVEDIEGVKDDWYYHKMTVYPSKKVEFETFRHSSSFTFNSENQCIKNVYQNQKPRYLVEGLFYRAGDVENIYVLSRTAGAPLPLYDELDKMIHETNPARELSKNDVLYKLEQFLKNNSDYCNDTFVNVIRDNINNCIYSQIKIKDIIDNVAFTSNFFKSFNRYLYNEYNEPLMPIYKYSEHKERFFGGFIGVKYFFENNALCYFVGCKDANDIQCCLSKRNIIRKVEHAYGFEVPNDIVKNFLLFMTADFVRESQFSVLPWQFKYLREYISQSSYAGIE